MITLEQAEKALDYLKATDTEYGRLRGRADGKREKRKTIKAMMILKSKGTGAEREAKADVSPEYKGMLEEMENAIVDYETLKAKRLSAALQIEMWRSCHAAIKQGNV